MQIFWKRIVISICLLLFTLEPLFAVETSRPQKTDLESGNKQEQIEEDILTPLDTLLPSSQEPESPWNQTLPEKVEPNSNSALLIIDVQNCFLPGGAIPIDHGDQIIPIINKIRNAYNWKVIAFSKDWHCSTHISFKKQHPGTNGPVELIYKRDPVSLCKSPGVGIFTDPHVVDCHLNETLNDPENYITFDQALWPDHCVAGTNGARLSKALNFDPGSDFVVLKGTQCFIDSYSAFSDNGNLSSTSLQHHLDANHIKNVFVTGLALDFCVKFTALDAKKLGYNTYVITDAAMPTSKEGGINAVETLNRNNVHCLDSEKLAEIGLRKQTRNWVSFLFAIPMLLGCIALLSALVIMLSKPKRLDDGTTTDEDSHSLLHDDHHRHHHH